MNLRSLLFIFSVILFLPAVNAQVLVSSHNITYELREGEALVEESILFVNPVESKVHTFDEDIVLLRRGIKNLLISGVPGRFNNNTPTMVYLEFSKSPIIRSSGDNTRLVTLTYSSSELNREGVLEGGEKVNVLIGNVLLPISPESIDGTTNIKIKVAEGLEFGIVLPPAEISNREIDYSMSKEERRVYSAFNVEIQYAKFKEMSQSNSDLVEEGLDDANREVEDARSAILNAVIYNANTTGAEESLNTALALIEKSRGDLALAKAKMRGGDFYQAYLFTRISLDAVEEALTAATDSERNANIQLRVALNKRISLLENMTAAAATPPTVNETKEEPAVEEEEPITPPPTIRPTVTPPPMLPVEKPPEAFSRKGVATLFVLLILASVVIISARRGGRRKEKLAAVKDFRAISDLKRKSYKDFDKEVSDVKKETNIAGEIRKLGRERSKYELGVENLNKKKLAGEVDEAQYTEVKRKFDGHIDELDKKIKALEKELPKKGGSDEKGSADRPEKGR